MFNLLLARECSNAVGFTQLPPKYLKVEARVIEMASSKLNFFVRGPMISPPLDDIAQSSRR